VAKTLSAPNKACLDGASSLHIQVALSKFKAKGANRWTTPEHTHPDGCLPHKFDKLSSLPTHEIIEAVALRGPLHFIDGWGYLAQALSALASGNPHAARHLAYYAELRGSMSILASQGIGIFNSNTAVVNASGAVGFVKDIPTHSIAWLALEYWAESDRAFSAIAKSVNIVGVPLLDSLAAYFPSPAKKLLGSQLIKLWGLDLKDASQDHLSRNASSYSPNLLTSIETTPNVDIGLFNDIWQGFEPSTFQIEKHLFRVLLETQAAAGPDAPLAGRDKEYQRLDPRVQRVVSQAFIERTESPGLHPLLERAGKASAPIAADEMIARACMLLRIAFALTKSNLLEAQVAPISDWAFWWSKYGAERGFWSTDDTPSELVLLWEDIALALEDAADLSPSERFEWLTAVPSGLPRLCETERICLWSLCG